MMVYRQLTQRMSVAQYEALKKALEVGKWPDGRRLSDEQKRHCMAGIIQWESLHVSDELRTGYIDRASKRVGQTCDDAQVLRFDDDQ
jgi:uncharacterized protein YeaC (DUF1315 family)